MPLRGELLIPGPAYAPRLVVFMLSLGRHANRVEIDGLQLTDAAGRPLLQNGGFEQGLAHWYFSSDRYHLPFHAKDLVVRLLSEQGLLGLGAFAMLLGAALWRMSVGAARHHPLAKVLANSILALLTVGLVDSLLDMPRVAFLTWLLLAVALCLPRAGGRSGQSGPSRIALNASRSACFPTICGWSPSHRSAPLARPPTPARTPARTSAHPPARTPVVRPSRPCCSSASPSSTVPWAR